MLNESGKQPVEATSDEKLLAMLSHLSIILGGVILPIIIWATQKDKSKFVRFHALQAIFYHIAYVVIIVAFVMLVVLFFVISGVGFGLFDSMNKQSTMPVAMIVGMIVFYAGLFGVIFAGIGYGLYFALKAYQGYLKRIPIIGKIIYRKVYGEQG